MNAGGSLGFATTGAIGFNSATGLSTTGGAPGFKPSNGLPPRMAAPPTDAACSCVTFGSFTEVSGGGFCTGSGFGPRKYHPTVTMAVKTMKLKMLLKLLLFIGFRSR